MNFFFLLLLCSSFVLQFACGQHVNVKLILVYRETLILIHVSELIYVTMYYYVDRWY